MSHGQSEDSGGEIGFTTARGRDWPSVRQFNVFVPNRVGGLLDVVRRFESSDNRIVSLTVVDTADCAIIRLVVRDPERAAETLEQARLPYTESDLLVVQLPDGASVARTSEAVRQVEDLLKSMPQIRDVNSVIGYSFLDSYSASNSAFIVAVLQPFEDRTKAADSAQALVAKTFMAGQQIQAATVFPLNLPPVIGLGTGGGFEEVVIKGEI